MTAPRTRPENEKPTATLDRYAHQQMRCGGNGQPGPTKKTHGLSAQTFAEECYAVETVIEQGSQVVVAHWPSNPKITIHCQPCARRFKLNEADTTKTPYLKRLQEDARELAEKKESPKTPRETRREVPQEAPAPQRRKSARARSSNPGQKKRGMT